MTDSRLSAIHRQNKIKRALTSYMWKELGLHLWQKRFQTLSRRYIALNSVFSILREPISALHHIFSSGRGPWRALRHVLSTLGGSKRALWLLFLFLLPTSVSTLVLSVCFANKRGDLKNVPCASVHFSMPPQCRVSCLCAEKCFPQEKASLPTLELPTKVNLFWVLTIQHTHEISTPTCWPH